MEHRGIAICIPGIISQLTFWYENSMWSYFFWLGLVFIVTWLYGYLIVRVLIRWLPFRENYNIPILSDITDSINITKRGRGRPRKNS